MFGTYMNIDKIYKLSHFSTIPLSAKRRTRPITIVPDQTLLMLIRYHGSEVGKQFFCFSRWFVLIIDRKSEVAWSKVDKK